MGIVVNENASDCNYHRPKINRSLMISLVYKHLDLVKHSSCELNYFYLQNVTNAALVLVGWIGINTRGILPSLANASKPMQLNF